MVKKKEVRFTSVFTLNYSSFAVDTNGKVLGWGSDLYGELGLYRSTDCVWPIFLMIDNVESLAIGRNHVMAIKNDNTLWAWGDNDRGVFGFEEPDGILSPIKIRDRIREVSTLIETQAVDLDGNLWVWKPNTERSEYFFGHPRIHLNNVKSVSVGVHHSAFIKQDGSAWIRGEKLLFRSSNELGLRQIDGPFKIADNAISIAVGDFATYVIKDDNSLWGFGANDKSQLGIGNFENQTELVKIMNDVRQVCASRDCVLAVSTTGLLFGWGSNSHHQLTGYYTYLFYSNPKIIFHNVAFAAIGEEHVIVLTNDNEIWCWGNNSRGQIGDKTYETRYYPTRVL